MSPSVEGARLEALRALDVLESPREAVFDNITRLASLTFDAPIAVVSLVDAERQWFKSCVGLDADGTSRDVAFCDHAIRQDPVMVVADATLDARFRDNPLVTGEPNIRFYAGAPLILRPGVRLGTLCIIDRRPRYDFGERERGQLEAMAATVVEALSMRRTLGAFERLERERQSREHLLAQAEKTAGLGRWFYDPHVDRTVWSPVVYEIHGLDPNLPSPAYEEAVNFYHPDDRPIVHAAVAKALESGEPYTFEARLIRRDGSLRHVRSSGDIQRDAKGAIAGLAGVFLDITDLVSAGEAVRASEARYRHLADMATDIIAEFGPDTRFTYLSPSIESVLGYKPDELLGRSTREIMHPEDYAASIARFRAHIASKARDEPFHFEYRAYRKDGAEIWLAGHPRAQFDPTSGDILGFYDVVRDVTEARLAQAALATSEFRFRLIAENASDIVMKCGPDGRIRYISPAAERLTGYRAEEIIGRTARAWVHPDDWPLITKAFAAQVQGAGRAPVETIRYRVLPKSGGEIWMESAPRVVLEPDGISVRGVVDAARDISERHRLETDLEAARDEAERAARVKADFLANMSHEIRTPLTAILGFTSLLSAREELLPEARTSVARIGGASQALLSIVNDVLDFSKLEAGQMQIRPRAIAPAECLAESLALFEPQAAAKNLALRLEAADLPTVETDPDRLRQILLNIVGNAVKFTPSGSVTLRASYEAARAALRVEVRDTGPGMAPEQLSRLFQRFSQVDASSTRTHGGTGLGLAICRALAEAMGGRIGVDSAPGIGTTFWFELHAPRATLAPVKADTSATAALSGLRVLVADDNQVNRELVRALLTPFGVDLTEAADGLAAVELALQQPLDVILMDIRMPGCDGPDAALRLRETIGPNQDIAILAFTADYDLDRYGEQAARGFDGIIRKPLDAQDLFKSLADATAPGPMEYAA